MDILNNTPENTDLPLPPTALLSEAERKRLEELATTGEAPVAPASSEEITTFEDGSTVKWVPRPDSLTQCILVDATGKQLAITKDSNIADFLANAVNLFVIATAKNNETDNPLQIMTRPIIIPAPKV